MRRHQKTYFYETIKPWDGAWKTAFLSCFSDRLPGLKFCTAPAMMPAGGWFASRIERASGQQGANRHRARIMRKLQNDASTAFYGAI
jgi:hypothetical protein